MVLQIIREICLEIKTARGSTTMNEQRITEHRIAIVGHDSSAQNVVCDYRMSRRGLAWEAPQVRKHGTTHQHIT